MILQTEVMFHKSMKCADLLNSPIINFHNLMSVGRESNSVCRIIVPLYRAILYHFLSISSFLNLTPSSFLTFFLNMLYGHNLIPDIVLRRTWILLSGLVLVPINRTGQLTSISILFIPLIYIHLIYYSYCLTYNSLCFLLDQIFNDYFL